MANAGDLRVISQAVTSVSQELAVLIDDVRTHLIHVRLCLYFVFVFFHRSKKKKVIFFSICFLPAFPPSSFCASKPFALTSPSSCSSRLSPALRRWAQLFVFCLQRIARRCPGRVFVLFQGSCAVTLKLAASASHRSTGMKTTTSSPSWEKTALKTQTWTATTPPVRTSLFE